MTIAADRYLKAILTIIAIELLWIGVRDMAPSVAAQAVPTPVIIRGSDVSLPVGIVGWTTGSGLGSNSYLFQSLPLPVALPR